MIYAFEDYRLDTDRLELWCGSDPIGVEPQVFSLLVYLVEHRDRVVGKDELIEHVWRGRIVSDATLGTRINAVRRAVGDDGKRQRIVRTVSRRGFRFIAEATGNSESSPEAEQHPTREPSVAQDTDRGSSTAGTETGADKPSVAVLPFLNLSGESRWEHFADGLTDDIISGLSRSRMFFVISRGSTFALKGETMDAKQIARELGVQYVVEGSVQERGNRVQITAQLVNAVADKHVWADRYYCEAADVFSVQDEITESVVATIAPELVAAEIYRVRRDRNRNFDAWDHFMRAYWHLSRFTREDFAEAKRLCGRALDIDPNETGAHSLMAIAHAIEALYGWSVSRTESMREARRLALRAVELNDRDSLALRALGLVDLYDRRHDDAIHNFRRAIEIDPHEAESHAQLGNTLGLAGDYDQARERVAYAVRLSPRDRFSATWFSNMSMAAIAAGNVEAALEWATAAVRANPQFPGGHRSLAIACEMLGRQTEAHAALDRLRELLPGLTIGLLRESLPFKHPTDLERYLEPLHRLGLPG